MASHRNFRFFWPLLPLLLLSLVACGTVTPHPVSSNTPTHLAPSQILPSPFPTATPTRTPQNSAAVISALNLNQLRPNSQWQHGEWHSHYAWTPDSKALVVSAYVKGPRISLLDANSYEEIWKNETGGTFDISTDGRWIAEVNRREIRILDAVNGNLVSSISGDSCIHAGEVRFSPNNQLLAVTDGVEIYILDRLNFECLQPFQQVPIKTIDGIVRNLIFSPDGGMLLAVTDRQFILWNISDGAEIKRMQGTYATFDPLGRWLAVGGVNGLNLYDWPSLNLVQTLPEYHARSISFSPDGRLLVTASADGTSKQLNFYNVEMGELLGIYRDLPFEAHSVAFRPDGRQILVQGNDEGRENPALFLTLEVQNQSLVSTGEEEHIATPTSWYRPKPLKLITQSPPLFPLLSTPHASQYTTPTPINTPVDTELSYRLKAWSESDGISAISQMVEYAHAGDVYGPSTSRPGFIILQDPIRTASLEYLLRFPRSSHEISIRWRLALANTVAGRSDSDHWITKQIEQGLNDGTIDPKDISSSLAPYGFVVNTRICPVAAECSWTDDYAAASPLIVTNLYENGSKTQIIEIRSVELVTGSMLAVMHQDIQGHFYVVSFYSGWGARYTEKLQVTAQDLTGDGRPEIWVDEYSHSGSIKYMTTYLYHWHGGNHPDQGRFTEVLNGQVFSPLDHYYRHIPGNENDDPGTFSLVKPYWGGFSEKETYRWNGFGFVLQDRKVVFPLDITNAFSSTLHRAMLDEQFEEIDSFLQKSLNNVSSTRNGPGAPDYITFQRAVNAVLADHPEEAQKILQDLLAAPANPNSPFISIVQAYHLNYRRETDGYRACVAAQAAYDRALSQYLDSDGYVSPEKTAKALGYTVNDDIDVCSLQAAFRQLVRKLDGIHPDQIPGQLAQSGVEIVWKTQLDVNGDGKTDWLLRMDQHETADAWLLLSGTEASELIFVGSFHRVSAGVLYEVLQLPITNRDAYLIKFGDRLKVFSVYPGDGGTVVETLLNEYGVTNYRVVANSTSTDLLIDYDSRHNDPQERKHWDAYLDQYITFNAQEEELLLMDSPNEVIRDIPPLLSLVNENRQEHYYPWLEPARLRYLLGLAYELSGDTENAAKTYYYLWSVYPNQPFAILARDKLELVRP